MGLTAEDEQALRALVHRYALGADQRDGAGFASVFAEDGVLDGPSFRYAGAAELAQVAPQLSRFARTYHMVHNCHFVADGEEATGMIYSASHHLTPQDDGSCSDYIMYITYHDRYRRTAQGWRIAHRKVDVTFTQTGTASIPSAA